MNNTSQQFKVNVPKISQCIHHFQKQQQSKSSGITGVSATQFALVYFRPFSVSFAALTRSSSFCRSRSNASPPELAWFFGDALRCREEQSRLAPSTVFDECRPLSSERFAFRSSCDRDRLRLREEERFLSFDRRCDRPGERSRDR